MIRRDENNLKCPICSKNIFQMESSEMTFYCVHCNEIFDENDIMEV